MLYACCRVTGKSVFGRVPSAVVNGRLIHDALLWNTNRLAESRALQQWVRVRLQVCMYIVFSFHTYVNDVMTSRLYVGLSVRQSVWILSMICRQVVDKLLRNTSTCLETINLLFWIIHVLFGCISRHDDVDDARSLYRALFKLGSKYDFTN